MSKILRASLAVVMAGALLTLPATAHAAPALAPVMLVLDASGSMKETIAGGTKMAAAKAAVRTLVQQAPEDARIGLAVYGTGTGNSAADKAAGCKDVTVAHKVGPLDRSALTSTVDGVQPRGYTPIGQSLRVAAAELPSNGQRSIVLVSDGVDTCAPPDPCEVARELAASGVDLRVHAIGFAVDGPARQQLTCLAQATGGTYLDAPDAATLARGLNRVTQQALRFYQPVGTPVQGTTTPDGAPKLATGNYLDRIGPDEKRYYAVDVPPGYTLHASATVVVPEGNDYFVKVYRYDTEECAGWQSSTATQGGLPVISIGMHWQAPSAGASASPSPSPCRRAGPQLLQVVLDPVFGGRSNAGDGALELLIGLEPPLTGAAGPEGTTDHVRFEAPPDGAAKPVVGGGSFTTAATLEGPGRYTDTVFEGEMVFYRIRLDWGQGLAFRMKLGQYEYRGTGGGFLVWGYLFDPVRSEVDGTFDISNGKEVTVPKEGSKTDAIAGPPVRYRNRELGGFGSGVSVAGWYYIAVAAKNDVSEEATPVPVTLEVSVNGNAQPAPGYVGGDTDPFGDQALGARDRDATDDAQGIWSTVANAGPLLWGGLVLLLLVAGGALILFLLMRRGSRPAGP